MLQSQVIQIVRPAWTLEITFLFSDCWRRLEGWLFMAGRGGRASGEERRPLANYHSALMHLCFQHFSTGTPSLKWDWAKTGNWITSSASLRLALALGQAPFSWHRARDIWQWSGDLNLSRLQDLPKQVVQSTSQLPAWCWLLHPFDL